MDEDVKLISEGKRKERRFLRAAVITAVIVAAFFIGFSIGYEVWSNRGDDGKNDSKTDDFRKRHEEIMNHHRDFQNGISQEQLEKNLKFFTETPHIAGSVRQKVIADELAKRWKDYRFDHVEMSEYEVLLSFPNTTNPSRVTIKYNNGTIIHQVKADTQKLGKDVVLPFLAYSPSGNVEGELVYANYGRVEDFERLKNLSVNVTGKIAIMRYGKIFRGNKVQNAATHGAKAALLYTDPAQYAQAGGDPNGTYPNTEWIPSDGVRRGTVLSVFGDPLTHGLPAIPGMYRKAISDSGLPPIPAYPMGYGDAVYFLSRIGGEEAPEDWRGALNITYRLGPGFTENKITVSVEINNYYKVKSIIDVIGTIYGDVEPDRYALIGNHRDAWVYGGVDPSSATAVVTEIARVLGGLKKAGWKPRRTIKICSWGAEEYGLLGSVEWVEQHEKLLSERAVIYLNIDMSVQGNSYMRMRSTPLVKDAIRDFGKVVHDPGAHDNKQTIFDIAAERNPSLPKTDPPEPAVGDLGSGSDYASFYQYIGVSAADFRYARQRRNNSITYPLYHTRYDTFAYVKKIVDPEFLYHKATAQFGGGLLLVYADSPLLNMNAMSYANALNETLYSLKRRYSDELKRHGPALGLLEGAIKTFHGAATNFTKAKEKLEKKLEAFNGPSFAELRRFNDRMMGIERAFIYAYGLPGRRVTRNVFLANSKYNNYGSSRFPGISDTLFKLKETGDKEEVDLQLSIAAQAVLSAVDILSGIA